MLADQARQVLGTRTLTATVNEALWAVVDQARRERLIDRLKTMRGLDLDRPEVMEDAWR